MSSTPPPLSPRPQRASSSSPHPEFAALLSSFESDSGRGFPGWRPGEATSAGDEAYATPLASSRMSIPEITTTSPSPLRPGGSSRIDVPTPASPSEGRLSPLPSPPARARLFGQDMTETQGILPRPRVEQDAYIGTSPLRPTPLKTSPPASEDQSTIDAAYEGVFSQFDALAGQPNLEFSYPTPPQSKPSRPIRPPASPSEGSSPGLAFIPLEAVSERTEPLSGAESRSPSPSDSHAASALSATSIARRFPLPPSPVKGPRSTQTASPTKASELIKMFEARADPISQPSFAPALVSRTTAMARASGGIPRQEPAPSSYRPTAESIFSTAPKTPPKSASPLSQVRTMIASWRARAGSPTQRVIGSPGQGGETPRLFGRDRAWNVSIRRRRRHDQEQNVLAEHGDEEAVQIPPTSPLSTSTAPLMPSLSPRTPSLQSVTPSARSSESRTLTGQPLRTGSLWYLNVHDTNLAPNFVWVQTDARLFPEGLQLVWRTAEAQQAVVVLDLEYCEEVASTYSPNNPMAGDDIGAIAARRQGALAEHLYPFKLVYDDGTERLGCDSARDRVRWVNAIWSVLERTRAAPASSAAPSIRSRPMSLLSSAGGGSSSTRYMAPSPSPVSPYQPLYTTDDAVITTSAGMAAPLAHRGSRRLAPGSIERARSLRRVASEADISESAGVVHDLVPSESDHICPPLTVDAARRTSANRDFTFAGGIAPPPLASPSVNAQTVRMGPASDASRFFSPQSDFTARPPTSVYDTAHMPSQTSESGVYQTATAILTSRLSEPFSTAQETVYAGGTELYSTAEASRETISSYETAPPPVPSHDSHYSTASLASSERLPVQVTRYQLHDPPVGSHLAQESRTTWHTAQSGTDSSGSTHQSGFTRQSAPQYAHGFTFSFASDTQEQSDSATHISEPNTDIGLLADLERQSSAGSVWNTSASRKGRKSSIRSGKTPFGTAVENTLFDTARETMYTTAPTWPTQTYMYSAVQTQHPLKDASSISSASTVAASSRRKPVPPPSPSMPNSSGWSSYDTNQSSESRTPNQDVNRFLNYIQGQDEARQGQQTKISIQLDRIETKMSQLTEQIPGARDQAPPVPSKDDSPPGSPSSVSSASTMRPVTPPPDAFAQQFDDMRHLIGTLIGKTNDLASEVARSRSIELDISDRGPGMRRIEDLLRRALLRLGDSEFLSDYDRPLEPEYRPREPATLKEEESMYEGTDGIYSDDWVKAKTPANSITESYQRKKRWSGVPASLLDGPLGDADFDSEAERIAMEYLPPDSPPDEYRIEKSTIPPNIAARLPRRRQDHDDEPYEESIRTEPLLEPSPESERDHTPIPYRPQEYEQEPSEYSDDYEDDRQPTRPLPPPQPVDLPTPVQSESRYPQMGQPPMRPPYPAGGMPPPPPPGMAEMPRPSLPRIAGVRDPISTTYFRRGFPPPGPMGFSPGMFPGPMGFPGPGMGPFMPGLRPGLNGFGGPLGPNVNPHLRQPGMFPPGVPNTGGYGWPAASRYEAGIPPGPRRRVTPDTGVGNTTSEETTPSTTEQLMTPITPAVTTPGEAVGVTPYIAPAEGEDEEEDDSIRQALHAQGDQQNSMSRYLHGMSDQIEDARRGHKQELADILGDIARLRDELKPKHVLGHVLPDGRVILQDGSVVDGIRGAPTPGVAPVITPPSAPHVKGKVMPDGTVTADGKIVDGIKGAPPVDEKGLPMIPAETTKDFEQDRKLASLEDKINRLLAQTGDVDGASTRAQATPLPTKRHHHEEELANVPATTWEGEAVTGPIDGAPATVRINPRTGKPVSMPKPLSLSPHEMSPIREEGNVPPGSQMIREETEEIIHRADGQPPVHTHTTSRTYVTPDGTRVTAPPVQSLGDPGTATGPETVMNVPTAPSEHHSDHQVRSYGNVPSAPRQQSTMEDEMAIPAQPAMDTSHQTVATTQRPAGKAKTEKPVWDTNPAKHTHNTPATTQANVPTAPGGAANVPPAAETAPPGGAANVPPTQTLGDAPSGGTPAQPASMSAPANAGTPSKNGKAGKIHWDPRLQERPPNEPGATTYANVPNAANPAGTALPPQGVANLPSVAGTPQGAANTLPVGTPQGVANTLPAGDGVPPVVVAPVPAESSGRNKLSKKEKEKLEKDEGGKEEGWGERLLHAAEVAVPAAIAGAEFGEHRAHEEEKKKDKEEKKEQKKAADEAKKQAKEDAAEKRKQVKEDHHMANIPQGYVAAPPGSTILPPGPGGAPAPAASGPSGLPASLNGGSHAAPGTSPTAPLMDEVTLPDGRKAYVLRNEETAPGKGKLTKGKPDKTGAVVSDDAIHDIGKMHCPMCCPSAPRDGMGRPLYHCVHQSDSPGPGPMDHAKPASMTKKTAPVPEAIPLPTGDDEAPRVPGKLKKGKAALGPEEELEDARKLATKQKAAAETAASEAAERKQMDDAKAAKAKMAEERHLQNAQALADLKRVLDALAADQKMWRTADEDRTKSSDKRRTEKNARDKKVQDALDRLVAGSDEAKKQKTADDKKPGIQAILDALKSQGDGQAQFLRKLAAEIMEQNSNQHGLTQAEAKKQAREQVGFNLAGYLDDFSKALSGEVRVLLKEVGDLRESRRALYMEIADLLLMKGRQSAGDLMAILPYPVAPPKNPQASKQQKDKPPAPPGVGDTKNKNPAGGVPAWSTFMPMGGPAVGLPNRPLPNPAGVTAPAF
ncbi:hypothetical protein BD324DRAFT_678476 [Kockovaella imperatae]|uniref:PH domain-containing protein n=1 Tax=Kockovaella imperatae TaxID=4999 RepID=A0A1Y1UST6_9TREE|nr:hypothetical protein BD324DRAFT_678476 [Kockovaella imperatae]ORX41083.1 hypothetical protein BD324DRAFT_678476 [Kockovaella imperatae]